MSILTNYQETTGVRKTKMAFLAPFSELAKMARNVAKELNEDITVYEGMDDYPSAETLQNEGYEVIITRGPMVNLFRQRTSIPIIRCDPAALDFFKAFVEAGRLDSSVGLVTSWETLFDQKYIENFLGIAIWISQMCNSKDDISRELSAAVRMGIKVVVGGTITADMALQYGLKCVKLYTGKETVVESIEKAKETVRVSREKLVENERLKIIIDMEQNGIISIDDNKIVTVFNAMAEEITGIKREEIIGRPIDRFFPESLMLGSMKEAKSSFGDIVKIGSVLTVNNRIPILVNNRVMGIVSTYQEVNKLQEIEAKVRKEINKKGFTAKWSISNLVGEAKNFKDTLSAAGIYARTESTVLITGETGTGKGLLAQGIHLASRRAKGPFVAVNCSALPESLLESELFGYEEGAFTGARRRGKQGLFELAHKGTIFLDEIAATSLNLQSRLLRVVEEKEVMRVGGDQIIPLDIRVIAASNYDLRKHSFEGGFRPDLFYRLNVLNLKLPPLRDRPNDILLLFRHFLSSLKVSNRKIESIILPEFSQALLEYAWPGNIRELEHFAEKVAALTQIENVSFSGVIGSLLAELRENQLADENANFKDGVYIKLASLEEMENEIIKKLYKKYCGNKMRLAKQLNISRTTLWKRLDEILTDSLSIDDD